MHASALTQVGHEHRRSEAGDEHVYALAVPADLPLFADHFAGSPLLPAFCQLGEVVTRIHEAWADLGPWQGAASIKFKAPIRPGSAVELLLRRKSGQSAVKFTIATGDTVFAEGVLKFGSADEAPAA